MINHTPPPNWVAERAKCRVDLIFEALSQVVRRDVEEANKLSARLRHDRTFTAEANTDGIYPLLRVYRTVCGESETIASFEQREQVILVQRGREACCSVHPEWHENRKSCVLVMMATFKQEFPDVWLLSQWTLEKGFFDLPA